MDSTATEVFDKTTDIPVDQLRPNPWNPNVMSDAEFTELVAEVKHLGRVPKPVVARKNGDGFEIIDGEHGHRAAEECGHATVACEVIHVDDFEAMRQTYKRNQSGTHGRVKEGRMFLGMMKARDISQRELVKVTGVPRHKIQDSIHYARAAERLAEIQPPVKADKLTIETVRLVNKIPAILLPRWAAEDFKVDSISRNVGLRSCRLELDLDWLKGIAKSEFLPAALDSKLGLSDATEAADEWSDFEERESKLGMDVSRFRDYSRLCFVDEVIGRRQLAILFAVAYDKNADCMRITAEQVHEFAKSSSPEQFQNGLETLIHETTGHIGKGGPVDFRITVLREKLASHAPDFIRASNLPLVEQWALYQVYDAKYVETEVDDWYTDDGDRDRYLEALHEIAKKDKVPRATRRSKQWDVENVIERFAADYAFVEKKRDSRPEVDPREPAALRFATDMCHDIFQVVMDRLAQLDDESLIEYLAQCGWAHVLTAAGWLPESLRGLSSVNREELLVSLDQRKPTRADEEPSAKKEAHATEGNAGS